MIPWLPLHQLLLIAVARKPDPFATLDLFAGVCGPSMPQMHMPLESRAMALL
jgi:hypothetical protein